MHRVNLNETKSGDVRDPFLPELKTGERAGVVANVERRDAGGVQN